MPWTDAVSGGMQDSPPGKRARAISGLARAQRVRHFLLYGNRLLLGRHVHPGYEVAEEQRRRSQDRDRTRSDRADALHLDLFRSVAGAGRHRAGLSPGLFDFTAGGCACRPAEAPTSSSSTGITACAARCRIICWCAPTPLRPRCSTAARARTRPRIWSIASSRWLQATSRVDRASTVLTTIARPARRPGKTCNHAFTGRSPRLSLLLSPPAHASVFGSITRNQSGGIAARPNMPV